MAVRGILKRALAGASRRLTKPKDGRPVVELLPWSLYHKQAVAATTAQTVTYFRSITGNTLAVSNLTTGGLLPWPQSMDVFSIAVAPEQGLNEADLVNFINNTVIELSLSNKPYLQIPLFRVPAGGGLHGFATTNNVFQAQNGLPAPMNTWSLAISGMSLFLPSQQDFSVDVKTFNTVAFTAAFDCTVYLDGVLARPVL